MYKNKPKGRRGGQRLSEVEKSAILALCRARELKQYQIAELFGLSVFTIQCYAAEAGIPRWRPIEECEDEVLELLRAGWNKYRIAKKTHVSSRVIARFAEQHGIKNPVGGGPKLPPEKVAAIVSKVREAQNYCNEIAEQVGVHADSVLTIAHKIRGPRKFIAGRMVPPMTSKENADAAMDRNTAEFAEELFRKRFDVEAQNQKLAHNYLRLVQTYADVMYGGSIPSNRAAFVDEFLDFYAPTEAMTPTMLQTWQRERPTIASLVRDAVQCLAASGIAN